MNIKPAYNKIVSYDFGSFLESSSARKIALAMLIAIVLFYDLSILNWSRNKAELESYVPVKTYAPNPLREKVHSLVSGYPMEKMIPYISQKEEKTAAFLVSIAKKESNWGKRSPRLNGKDCFNYWGYRKPDGKKTWDGFTCFDSPREAVNVVSLRLENLIDESGLDTPQKMVVWKCGWDCSWDNPLAVKKWARDVDYYFQKFY